MELSKVQQVVALLLATAFVAIWLAGCDVVTSGGPLDRVTALQQSQSELPLPPSARDVYYYHIDRGTQDHDLFVRFSGEPKDIEQFATAYFKEQNAFRRKLGKAVSEPLIETSPQAMAKKPGAGRQGLPDWWHPDKIKKGLYIGSKPETFPIRHFWIDEAEGRAYFYGHY
jgi:hypothetical protein